MFEFDGKPTTLGAETDVFVGYPFRSDTFCDDGDGIRLLRGDNISQGRIVWADAKRLSKESAPDHSTYELREGDVVLAMDRPWVGAGLKHARIRKQDTPSLLVQRTACLRGKGGTSTDFIYYVVAGSPYAKYIQGITTGSLVPHISKEQIQSYPFLLPPPTAQREIAAVLSALDAKIDLNNRINAELEALAKTIYDYWFVQFDLPDANGRPYKSSGGAMVWNDALKREIPVGWNAGSLWDIATYTNGLAMQKFRPKGDDFLPVIKIKEMSDGFSSDTERASPLIGEKFIVDDGDILFSWSATLAVQIWARGRGALNQHIFKVTSETYPKSFIYFELLNYLGHFKMMAEKRKTTMGHITLDHLRQSAVVIPPLPLIKELDKLLRPTFDQCVGLSKQNLELAQLRDWLLPLLMNGQVRVD
ncbi:MAG: hypothetical protein BGP25_06670 [Lysobacterales bacterium 63-13]|mgnify:CR=1 FL=1|nr:MAG: hypothetical protein BGP25_06670 [Xanthomonadales bacterium 63-13]